MKELSDFELKTISGGSEMSESFFAALGAFVKIVVVGIKNPNSDITLKM